MHPVHPSVPSRAVPAEANSSPATREENTRRVRLLYGPPSTVNDSTEVEREKAGRKRTMREERKFYIALLRRFDAAVGLWPENNSGNFPCVFESLAEIRARARTERSIPALSLWRYTRQLPARSLEARGGIPTKVCDCAEE